MPLNKLDTKQMWDQMEPLDTVAVSSALSAMTTSEDGLDQFAYYIAGANFRRYDKIANTWQKLAPPLVTPTVFASLRFSKYGGTFGRVISCPSSTTLRIAPINAPFLNGKTIRIISGTGAGQVRTITASPEATKYEHGLATTASATTLGDSTKKWNINQWRGYQVRITYGTGATQVRRILYNDATTLYVSLAAYQPIEPWNNQGFAVPIPVVTAGLQAHFVIEATDITVAAWTVNPDYSSQFKVETGGVWLLTAAAAAPFYSLQYYDIAGDFWITKTGGSSLITAAWTVDGTLERTGEVGGVYESGTASAGGDYRLTDATKTFTFGKYQNYRIRITGGTGVGQSRRILCSDVTGFEVARKWDTNPDATSTYEVIADKDKIYIGGNGQARMLQYDVDSDLTLVGSKFDDGISNALAARYPGIEQVPISLTSGTRTISGITAVAAAPTAGGTLYSVGDVLTITTGGTNGKVIVTSTTTGGVVTGVALQRSGSGYTSGAGKATSGGTGTLCTVNISTIGTVTSAVTDIVHPFKIGEQVVLSGDAAYAGTVTIIGVDGNTRFDFATAAAANMTAAAAQAATLIVDSTKNWTVNEHVGKILQTHLTGLTGVVQPRVITANTANTITVATITTPLVNGTGRYAIVSPYAFGRDDQHKDAPSSADGHATGGSNTTLQDTSKNWLPDMWIGYKVRIEAGTGRDVTMTVTSNTNDTLTYAGAGFTPDATSHYRIQDSYGTCTGAGSTSTLVDATKLWQTNQWAGKRVVITGGAGFGLAAALNEITIVSNTTTTLTFTAIVGFAPDATTTYTIVGNPIRGAGTELIWLYGGVSAGRYMFFPRGGASNTADRYDLTTEKWEYGFLFSPQTDTMTTGSYYAYDGGNRVYFCPGVATGIVQYVYYYDFTDNRVYGFGSVTNTQLAPVIGNRMEIMVGESGKEYLYHIRNTGTEMYRACIWF